MDRDLTPLLREWPFESGQINVRLIEGVDGEPRIQMRLDLGVIQMTTEGRPDGTLPGGHESFLDLVETYMEHAGETASITLADLLPDLHGETSPAPADSENVDADNLVAETSDTESQNQDHDNDTEIDSSPLNETGEADEPFGEPAGRRTRLAPDVCRALREEAMQYYHRYIALLVLEDFEAVCRDTRRNLRVLDLCQNHAQTREDRAFLEQFRPYITMMHGRALASLNVQRGEGGAAALAVDEAIEALRSIFTERGDPESFETSTEVLMLRGIREALAPKLPVSQQGELKKRLSDALARENYELAAILRDELRLLGE